MRHRLKARLHRTVLTRSSRSSRSWDGEGEALRLRLMNLIAGDEAEDGGEADAVEPEAPRAIPVRTLRGLIAWADPAEADGDDGGDDLTAHVLPGTTTVH